MWTMNMDLQKSRQVCEAQSLASSVQNFQGGAGPRKQRYAIEQWLIEQLIKL